MPFLFIGLGQRFDIGNGELFWQKISILLKNLQNVLVLQHILLILSLIY
jgi:hypothetical protein